MDKESHHIVQVEAHAVTDLSLFVKMDLHVLAQVAARAVRLFTEDVLMVTSVIGNAKQGSHIVLGSPRIETPTMAPEYITQDLAGQETRKVDTIGKEISLATVLTLIW